MHSSTYLKWFRRLLILGAVVAGLTASAAGARVDPGTPPDVSDVAFQLAVTPATDVARTPDVRDVAGSVSPATADVFERYASAHPYGPATADAFERYASAHPYGVGPASSELVSSPPDVQDAAAALHVTPQGLTADGLRWNGVARAYMQLQQSGTSVESGGFDWNDYAIGIGSAMGLIALAAGLTMAIRLQRRHPLQST